LPKRALITGIAGQDGSYLAEDLLEAGYEVHGVVRRAAIEAPTQKLSRIASIRNQVKLHTIDVESFPAVVQLLRSVAFDYCYHLAAESFVAEGFAENFCTVSRNLNGTFVLLEVIRQFSPSCRFFFAGSSEMFGQPAESPQNEGSPMAPISAYGFSKLFGFQMSKLYRYKYGMFTTTGILYNHESERRSNEYVSKKITAGVARIVKGQTDKLLLGNLDSVRDWGYSPDYVKGMRAILEHATAEDYVLATGVHRTVRDFCRTAFEHVGLDYRDFVQTDAALVRKFDSRSLLGNASKANTTLGWYPMTKFEDMVGRMVDHELLSRDLEIASIKKTA
jgi:GDPmannose 4,6-dehydratase